MYSIVEPLFEHSSLLAINELPSKDLTDTVTPLESVNQLQNSLSLEQQEALFSLEDNSNHTMIEVTGNLRYAAAQTSQVLSSV